MNADIPCWNNGYLPGLDMIALYSLIRLLKPKKYIEIGSGNSTKVVRKAISDEKLISKVISIDPFPRANIDHLADMVIRKPLEDMDMYDDFQSLESGDVVFVDNSHRCLPNSDVMVFFLEVLPFLPKGVLVHIHDIYLPYDYPQFMCDRVYSEQYMLATTLLANPEKYKPILPAYFVHKDEELRKTLAPIWGHPNLAKVEQHGGSFWFQVG